MTGQADLGLKAIEGDFIDALAEIFEGEGAAEYLGEEVTIAEHMIQTAVRAERSGAPDALVAAALLHDVGHFAHGQAAADDWHRKHDLAGAAFLAGHFGPDVVEPVRLHVAAKRYLCAVEPDYFDKLSAASVHTLEKQGGPMSPEEARAFESDPHFRDAVTLRRWEDDGKIVGETVPSFAAFRPLLERLRTDR
jgi:gamma-butyrobetaine dioxygenase